MVRRIGPVIGGIYDGQTKDRCHRVSSVQPGEQIKRLIGPVDTADGGARKSSPQFLAHGQDGFATVRNVGVPALSKIDPQRRSIPCRRETDLWANKRFISHCRPTCRWRCWRNIADELHDLVCYTHFSEQGRAFRKSNQSVSDFFLMGSSSGGKLRLTQRYPYGYA